MDRARLLSLQSLCVERGILLVTAESCTGGMLAATLTELSGASLVFDRGFVTYSNRAKVEMLGVREETLGHFGAVSEAVAEEMARGALARSCAQISVAITGIAGPGGSETKPEGRVCFGFASRIDGNETVIAQTIEFGALGRGVVRARARDHAIHGIWKLLH